MLSRRKLIAISLSLTAAVTLGAGLTAYSWWDTEAEEPYQNLNTEEATLIRALSGAAFPAGEESSLTSGEAKLDRFFDLFIGNIDGQNRRLLRFFLHILNHTTLLNEQTLFVQLAQEKQVQQLERWLLHDNHLFRSAIQSLIAILGMGYTTHPKVTPLLTPLHRCGYG